MMAEQLAEKLKSTMGSAITRMEIRSKKEGAKKVEYKEIWLTVSRESFKDCVKDLMRIEQPHLAVVSGEDIGSDIRLTYHFSLFYAAERNGEVAVNVQVLLPKSNPTIPTITDLIPGALVTEKEKQEMLGVVVEGIPDGRKFFLPEDFPDGAYPWRKDDKGVANMVRPIGGDRK